MHLHSTPSADTTAALTFPAVTATTSTLPNGLGIIVQEDRSAPVASVQVWIETGSIHEDRHLGAGISHLLEHMLFKGTPTRGASEFAQRIQAAGGYINAYTSFDRTVYWIDIPAKGVATALDLLSDAVMNSTLPPDEYVKEQEVIRREFAMGNDDPDRVASQTLFATAFREHPYRHPIIGHLDVFNALSRDEVMAYYKARYVPNNMFFVVVGDVDAAAVRAQLAEIFAKHPRVSLPPVFIPAEPAQLGRREAHTEFAHALGDAGQHDVGDADAADEEADAGDESAAQLRGTQAGFHALEPILARVEVIVIDPAPCAFQDTLHLAQRFIETGEIAHAEIQLVELGHGQRG